MVSVTSGGGFVRPVLSDAVPETVTDLFGASVALFVAVTVTSPVLAVAFAAKVSVVAVLSVKSPAAAFAARGRRHRNRHGHRRLPVQHRRHRRNPARSP